MRYRLVYSALAAAGLLAAPPTNAASFTVGSTADAVDASPGDGLCQAVSGFCTLRAAIQETNALAGADEIQLPAGTFLLALTGAEEDLAATGDLDLRDALTITGAGPARTIVDGGSLDRVVDVKVAAAASITLRGLQLAHGRLPAGADPVNVGGGLRVDGPVTLVIDDCRLHGHRATSEQLGYAVGVLAANRLDLLRSEVDDCRRLDGSPKAGAAIYLGDDGADYFVERSWIHANDGIGIWADLHVTLHVTESTIELQGSQGIMSGGSLYLERSTVAYNQSGGIATGAVADFVFARSSTISGNLTNGWGGGFFIAGGIANLVLSSCTITGNVADGDADGMGDGGGIYSPSAGLVRLRHTILGGNYDDSPTGNHHPDCSATLVSEGFNLISSAVGCTITGDTGGNIGGVLPGIGPLAWQGGVTPVHVPLAGSPVVDAGDDDCTDINGSLLTVDQRGYPREVEGDQDPGAYCDMGAGERNPHLIFQDGFESGTCWAWSAWS